MNDLTRSLGEALKDLQWASTFEPSCQKGVIDKCRCLKLISNTPGIGEINACGDTSNGVTGIPVTNYVSKGEISFLPTKQEQVLGQFAQEATSFRSW